MCPVDAALYMQRRNKNIKVIYVRCEHALYCLMLMLGNVDFLKTPAPIV